MIDPKSCDMAQWGYLLEWNSLPHILGSWEQALTVPLEMLKKVQYKLDRIRYFPIHKQKLGLGSVELFDSIE